MTAIEEQIEHYRRKCYMLLAFSPEWYSAHAQGSKWVRLWRQANTLRAV
jgi:hypothetical protein